MAIDAAAREGRDPEGRDPEGLKPDGRHPGGRKPDDGMAGSGPAGSPETRTSQLLYPEARFRIRAPNSVPRAVRVIALDDDDPEVRACHVRGVREHVVFSGPADFDAAMAPSETGSARTAQQWIASVDSLPARITEWLANPDLVVIVGAEGDNPSLGVMAAEAYRSRGVTVSSLIRRRAGVPGDTLTSDALRPVCSMMVLVDDSGYLDDLLDALGA
jgi:hypothetical protein